jgi:hypothetical protein
VLVAQEARERRIGRLQHDEAAQADSTDILTVA